MKEFTLPELPYAYNALEPQYDEQTLRIHHDKHHAGYVKGLNTAMQKLAQARESNDFALIKHWEREQAFHGAGHHFHTLFWENMRPATDNNQAQGDLAAAITQWFGGIAQFEAQFKAATAAVEGSGWGVLASDVDGNLHIFTVENHQKAFIPGYKILLVCDVWEHAYYLKYQNRRAEWIENFFKIINWEEVEKRL